ncbi:MAG TPA: group III truncated hemoglobin [Ignavibacteriaceae bacterium]|nr:group III truncated hemoglobin [Ignavibacteriaceae bacterium]
MKDILNISDIILLVDSFYKKVNLDKLLSPIFNDVAKVDWDAHLPVMYSFWSAVLFDTNTYKGQPVALHLNLPITKDHFKRWLELFKETVDEHFSGEKAEIAKERADSIAEIFKLRLGLVGS